MHVGHLLDRVVAPLEPLAPPRDEDPAVIDPDLLDLAPRDDVLPVAQAVAADREAPERKHLSGLEGAQGAAEELRKGLPQGGIAQPAHVLKVVVEADPAAVSQAQGVAVGASLAGATILRVRPGSLLS